MMKDLVSSYDSWNYKILRSGYEQANQKTQYNPKMNKYYPWIKTGKEVEGIVCQISCIRAIFESHD